MREHIAEWAKTLEGLVAAERGDTKFKSVARPNEYINVMGHDSSILEVVLERGLAAYHINIYTRVVWSERNPAERPFAFSWYVYTPDPKTDPDPQPEKPKQAFYDDQEYLCEYLTAAEVEKKLHLSAR